MTGLVAQKQSLSAVVAADLNFKDSYVQLIKDTFAKGATDDELALFLQTVKRTGLDPIARQLFLVKRYDAKLKTEVMSIQISIDGFRLIADRTDKYVPSKDPTFVFKGGTLESATAYIKKFVGGVWHDISATAYYDEYVQETKEGQPNRMWQKMPRLMLAKCAESLALRKAFPAELSGLYTVEEMGNDMPAPNLEHQQAAIETEPASVKPTSSTVQTEEKSIAERADKEMQIGMLCKSLNLMPDSIKWTNGKNGTLTDYVNNMFETSDGLNSLSFENLDFLIGDLQGRLETLKNPPVEGEIVEE